MPNQIVKGEIGNALTSVAPDHILAVTNDVFDEELQMYQSEINKSSGVYDISVAHASGGTPATYADLTAALGNGGENVPSNVRKPGMSVKFINSVSGQYVQYRLMSATWSTAVSNWQGMDEVPIYGSRNLAESGGVVDMFAEKVGGLFATNAVPVVSGTILYSPKYKMNIKSGTNIHVKVQDTILIVGDMSCSLWYGDENSEREIIRISSDSDTSYTTLHDIKEVSYHKNSDSIVGTGNVYIDFSVEQIYTTKQEFGLLQSKVASIAAVANGVEQQAVIDSDLNIVKSNGIAGDLLSRIGGVFKSIAIPVSQNQLLSVVRNVFIRAEIVPTIKFRLVPTVLVTTHINLYFYYEGLPDSEHTMLTLLNDGGVYGITVGEQKDKNIVKIMYQNPPERNVGSGTLQVEYIGEYQFLNDSNLIPINNEINALKQRDNDIENSVKDIADDVIGVPPSENVAAFIDGSGSWFHVNDANYSCIKIRIVPGSQIKIGKGTAKLQYGVLREWVEPVDEAPINFSVYMSGRQVLPDGETEASFTAPTDAMYLVVNSKYGGNSAYAPSYATMDGKDVLNGEPSLDERVSTIESEIDSLNISKPFVRYTASALKFEIFTKVSDFYYSFVVSLSEDANIVQKVWRITGGFKYDKNLNQICSTIIGGENEFTSKWADYKGFENFIGGFHGGELIDGDGTCFVKFFVDGRVLTDEMLGNDFELNCDEFKYIQNTTLNKVYDNNGVPIANHPIFAHHRKETSFCSGKIETKNTIVLNENATITQYFSGLFCTGKGAASVVLIPYDIIYSCQGDNAYIEASDKEDSNIIMWNSTNRCRVEISSSFVRGINWDNLTQKEHVWDRPNDSKYYRYLIGPVVKQSGDIIETKQKIVFY